MDDISKSKHVNPSAPVDGRILVVGLVGGWREGLAQDVVGRVLAADLLVGGKRQLALFDEFTGERLAITANIEAVVARLRTARLQGERAVVLASGDPLCYGIGATLRRYFAADALQFLPAPSAFQLAFAAVGEAWHDARLLSAHGRDAGMVLATILTNHKTAILTDGRNSPDTLARNLLAMGMDSAARCVVCEQLASADERIVETTIGEAALAEFAALNVMLVWNDDPLRPIAPHLPDSAFVTARQQITKRAVRLAVLAEIGLQAGETLWDIGSGSGSVAIEAARSRPTARVIGVEKSADMIAHWRQNATTHRAFNATLIEGIAPAALDERVPSPDVVFIGGSGGNLDKIIALAKRRLPIGGRLVASFATLENLQTARTLLSGCEAYQMHVNRLRPIANKVRLAAQNPVFILKWVKPQERVSV